MKTTEEETKQSCACASWISSRWAFRFWPKRWRAGHIQPQRIPNKLFLKIVILFAKKYTLINF